jgi:UDP-3-O-[3-hydroxymyristoyl] N-acetylglucosamine deacetylase/3-hydroxyacyl-[acyl-carrier-protein] dehydratase
VPQPRLQRTIKTPVEFRGIGLHSGKEAVVVIKPAEAGSGISFIRTDLADRPEVAAHASFLKTRERRSCLQDGLAEVFTVEHLMASIYAVGLDNLDVEISAEEVPGMDGSALEFVRGLRQAGIVEQKSPRIVYTLKRPLYVQDDKCSLVALPSSSGGLSIDYHLEFDGGEGNGAVQRQSVHFRLGDEAFERDIAPARTFVFEHEVEALVASGLGKGASTQNTLIVGKQGIRDNTPRVGDELARHKVLDLVGDLATIGVDLEAHVIATRTGHNQNMALAQQLIEEMRNDEDRGEVTHETGLEIREILKILPHRYPFVMIDRVIRLDGYKRAVAIKNVSINEPFFQGHWPGQPIMPGVLILEAMAQLAGVLLLRKLENTGKLAVLWSIDRVKLRGAVVPGDTLRIEVDTLRSKPSLGHVAARGKVGSKLVAEAELKFTLIEP